MKILFKVTS